MTFRVYEHGHRALFDRSVWTWHQAVSNVGSFYHQHYRWHRGALQAFRCHWRNFYRSPHTSLLQKLDFTEVFLVHLTGVSLNVLATLIALSSIMGWELPVPYLPFVIFPLVVMVIVGIALYVEGEGDKVFPLPVFGFYAMLQTLPNLAAFTDEVILHDNYKGRKAERVVYPSIPNS